MYLKILKGVSSMCMVRVSKTKFIVDFWVYFCICSIEQNFTCILQYFLYSKSSQVIQLFDETTKTKNVNSSKVWQSHRLVVYGLAAATAFKQTSEIEYFTNVYPTSFQH